MQRVKLEFILLIRNRAMVLMCALIILCCFFAVQQGKERVNNEQDNYAKLLGFSERDFSDWKIKSQGDDFDFGSMGYYYFEPALHPAEPLAALFNGQRVIDTLSHNIRLLALTGQVYGQEKHNPNLQMHGYLDLAFILVFVVPLLIGVMTCRLWSTEKESGRLLLLKSVVTSDRSLINFRFGLIYCFIALFQFLLLGYGFLSVGLSIGLGFLRIYLALVLYQTFWFMVSWLINCFRFQSVKGTLIFICVWIFFTLVIPGAAINYSQYRYPATQGINMMLDQRQHMHNSWDRDRQADLNEFYQLFPQYADSKPLPEAFHWKWYFAMQLMSDRKVSAVKQEYWQQIKNRITLSRIFSYLSPAMALQIYLTKEAKTDMHSQMQYWQALEAYHQSLFDYFAQHLFYDKRPSANLPDFPKFHFSITGASDD